MAVKSTRKLNGKTHLQNIGHDDGMVGGFTSYLGERYHDEFLLPLFFLHRRGIYCVLTLLLLFFFSVFVLCCVLTLLLFSFSVLFVLCCVVFGSVHPLEYINIGVTEQSKMNKGVFNNIFFFFAVMNVQSKNVVYRFLAIKFTPHTSRLDLPSSNIPEIQPMY